MAILELTEKTLSYEDPHPDLFKVLKDVEMIEVKQGPYSISNDKVKFDKTDENKIKFKKK